MKARQLISGGTFSPGAMETIGLAFDQAWAEVAERFKPRHPLAVDAAQRLVADAILANATDESRDPDALSSAGLRTLTLRCPWIDPETDL